jgi:eukaryotic-like serine/threonine-protein kinase
VRGRHRPHVPNPPPAPDIGEEPALPLALVPPSSGAWAATSLRPVALHALWRAVLWVSVLAVAAILCIFLFSRRERVPREPEVQPPSALPLKPAAGQEVASLNDEPEAEHAAAPSEPEPTAAAVASRAAPLEDTSAMKTRNTPDIPLSKKQRSPGLGPVGKKLATGAACATLACTTPGSQVRPDPPDEPCPPGALETMAQLNIKIGAKGGAVFPPYGTGLELISVREGWTSINLVARTLPGDLPAGSILKGRLVFGAKRVYGRWTQAQEPDGTRTWPVCLEMLDSDNHRGLEMESGSTADTARVLNSTRARAVDRFQGG